MDSYHRVTRSPIRAPSASDDRSSLDRSNAGSRQSNTSTADSGSETSSNPPLLAVPKRQPLPSFTSQRNLSNVSLSRPSAQYMPTEPTRKPSAMSLNPAHRRQHSQGYFEPSMPSTSQPGLTPSQIAAQAAMQHLTISTQHIRRRSSTIPVEDLAQARRNSHDSSSSNGQSLSPVPDTPTYRNGLVGNKAATTAATAVWKPPPEPEKEKKTGGLRRFRPKNIGIISGKDKTDVKPMPSPNKLPTSGLAKVYNASSTSLVDNISANSSMYNLNQNPSVTTILPADEKKKHTGLRQKLKLKDKDDQFNLPLSSANSNSRPVDVNNPQSLYSFAPSSPNTSTFTKSMSGLDLRHGARALRKDKKEREKEKQEETLQQVHSKDSNDSTEWPSLTLTSSDGNSHVATPYSRDLQNALSVFGLNNMTPDDAWEFLKARLLSVFSDEHVPLAIEDLNRLVTIHVQRCVLKRDPSIIIGDLENLLHTGFASLNHTLRGVREEGLVSVLVEMWLQVFGRILPFIQAVFLPLDQEFKGRGSVLKTPMAAAEFWGALPSPESIGRLSSSPSSASEDTTKEVAAGEELEVRRMLLMSYRDHVILPRFEILKNTFSRLSLDSINATLAQFDASQQRGRGNSLVSAMNDARISSSYSSQTSTLLGGATPYSQSSRSRATSNLSAGSSGGGASVVNVAFDSLSSPPPANARIAADRTTNTVTETVGRMLQCLSILVSVQSNDEAQQKTEELTRELKLNWLGRGRTGRNRKGFVGSRVRPGAGGGVMGSGVRSIASTIRGERDGSPTPTPTRQGTVSERVGRLVV